MRRHKKLLGVLAIIAAVIFLVISLAPVFVRAATKAELQSQLDAAQQKKAAAQQNLNNVQADISDAKTKREELDKDISALESEIYTLQQEIDENEAQLSVLSDELDAAIENAAEYEDTFKNRVRVMYERNSVSYLNLIFGAQSFSDLIKRVELVAEIVKYDNTVMDRMAEAQAEIKEKKDALEESNEVVKLSKEIQDAKKAELDTNKESLNVVLANLEADADSYKATLDEADAAEAALRAEIKSLTEQSSASSATSSGTSSQSGTTGQTQTTYSGGAFSWPAPSTSAITSEYGMRYHPTQGRNKMHTGIDIGASYGSSVIAAEGGTVLRAGWNSGYGNYVVIDHGGGVQTLYGHCSSLLVSSGQSVSRGQQIALVGSTGVSTGPHLHFEVLINGSYTDPMGYFG